MQLIVFVVTFQICGNNSNECLWWNFQCIKASADEYVCMEPTQRRETANVSECGIMGCEQKHHSQGEKAHSVSVFGTVKTRKC